MQCTILQRNVMQHYNIKAYSGLHNSYSLGVFQSTSTPSPPLSSLVTILTLGWREGSLRRVANGKI